MFRNNLIFTIKKSKYIIRELRLGQIAGFSNKYILMINCSFKYVC